MSVERVRLDGAGDDGEPGWFTAGAHVEDKVLVSDVSQRPHVRQPGGDILVILGAVAVDEGIEAQPALPGAREVRYGNISKFKDYWIN